MTQAHVEKYCPSNGTEGEGFISAWCGKCERSGRPGKPCDAGHEVIGCSIVGRSMAFDIDDAEYPAEWIQGKDGPECTAFVPLGEPLPAPRCVITTDMFDGKYPILMGVDYAVGADACVEAKVVNGAITSLKILHRNGGEGGAP
jgi:hypothetical protein